MRSTSTRLTVRLDPAGSGDRRGPAARHPRAAWGRGLVCALILAVMLPVDGVVWGAAPPAGTEILNQAEATFLPSGAIQPVRRQSGVARAVVEAPASLALSGDRTLTLGPGTTATLARRILYTGSGPAAVDLTLANQTGDGYDLQNLRWYQDVNTNGIVDPGEPLLAPTATVTLTPGAPFHVVILGDVPASGVTAGKVAQVRVSATVSSSSLSFASLDLVTVAATAGAMFIQIAASRQIVEMGDLIDFTVLIRNATGLTLDGIHLTNDLPAGFAYQKGSATLNGQPLANPQGKAGPKLTFDIGTLPVDATATVSFRVRSGPGSTQGNGITRARARSSAPQIFVSNIGSVRVNVKQGGVFTDAGVVLGKVFIDSNQNREQDPGELGIPGVRIYLEDGTYVITDSEGKYSFYGVTPKSHVLKLDETTLPRGASLLAPSTRHAGSGGTRFVDINRGELHKANFTVGYATTRFVEEVKKRRIQAEQDPAEIDNSVKARLSPDGAPIATADPRTLPAAGIVGAPPSSGPSLLSGMVPGAPRPASGSTPGLARTNVGIPTPPPARVGPQTAFETLLARVTTNTLGFLDFKDGDTLPQRQATVRVVGPAGGKFLLRLNGEPVAENRIGARASIASLNLEAWEYVGVEFTPGQNLLEVLFHDRFGNPRGRRAINLIAPSRLSRITLLPPKESPVADGKTPARIRVQLTDASGIPITTRTPLTLEASLGQWKVDDLDKTEPGTQVFIEGGTAEYPLLPPREPGESKLRVSSGALRGEGSVTFLPELRPMLAVGIVEGTINLSHIDAKSLSTPRSQDGFEQELHAYGLNGDTGSARAAGRAAFFLKGKILGKYLLTAGYDSDKDTKERLFRDIQPDEFYPVYGDSSVKGYDAQSTGKLYVRVDRNKCYLLYGDFNTASPSEARNLGNYSRSLTGLKYHLENSRVNANAWASQDSTRQVIEEQRGNGTSGPYGFSARNGLINSEKVEIITRDRHQSSLIIKTEPLTRFADYEFEPFTGRILLRRPIPSLDANLNPIFLRVTFEVDQGGDKFWTYGADGQVKLHSRLELGGSAIRDENPLGAYGLYSANATVKLAPKTYIIGELARSDTELKDGNAGRVELRHADARTDVRVYYAEASTTFSNSAAAISAGRVEAGANLSYRLTPDTRLVGQAIDSQSLLNHGERKGATLSVERTFPNKVRVEVGGRYSVESTAPASPSTASPPGITPNEVASVRAKVTVPVPLVKNASVYGEIENDVVQPDKRLVALGGEYQLAKTRVYARHEFLNALGGPYELNNFQQQNTTVFGVDSEYMKEGSVFNEYRGRDSFAGRESEAAIGLRNGWSLSPGLRLHTTFERITPIEGGGNNEATAGAAALEYTRNPNWKGTARVEVRVSPTSDSLLNTLGYARKLNTDWTFLTKTIFYGVENNGASDGTKIQSRFQTGLAYRQTDKDKWNALGRYELKYESDSTQPALDQDRLVHIISLHANYHPTRDWILSGHYAGKLVTEDINGDSGLYSAHLLSLRATYDLTKRLDVGINSSLLFDGKFHSIQYGFGPEIGWTFMNNVRIAAGFNMFGFMDRDLAAQDYTNPGFFVNMRLKFDESFMGLGNNSKERGKP